MPIDAPKFSAHSRRAKHALLAHYLPVWAKVLGGSSQQLRFVDGFAHEGWYEIDGEGVPGSPLVAIEAFKKAFENTQPPCEVKCHFIDNDAKAVRQLESNIRNRSNKPNWIRTQVHHGDFEDAVSQIIKPSPSSPQAPTFVFIDPYGPKGFPFTTIQSILAGPRTEVLINIMWNRAAFNMAKAATQHLYTNMFGGDEWRQLLELPPAEKAPRLVQLYMQKLHSDGGARIARKFDVYKGSELEYWLVFATNSAKGWAEMKRAMWKIDTLNGERYYDTTDPGQLVLFEREPDFSKLKSLLLQRFLGKGPIEIEAIEDYVLIETPFLKEHIRERTLDPMKKCGELEARTAAQTKQNRGYPPGTTITFMEAPPKQASLLW